MSSGGPPPGLLLLGFGLSAGAFLSLSGASPSPAPPGGSSGGLPPGELVAVLVFALAFFWDFLVEVAEDEPPGGYGPPGDEDRRNSGVASIVCTL